MEVVIVTGSSGFIGRPVIRRLAQDFRMIGFDRDGGPHPPPEAECVGVDLTSDESVKAAFERVRYAYGDIGRARTILDWEPKQSLRVTLPRMVSALKADPVQFYNKNKLEAPSWLEESVVSKK